MTAPNAYLDCETPEQALEVSKRRAQRLIGKRARILVQTTREGSHAVVIGVIQDCDPWPGRKLILKRDSGPLPIPWEAVLYVMTED